MLVRTLVAGCILPASDLVDFAFQRDFSRKAIFGHTLAPATG